MAQQNINDHVMSRVGGLLHCIHGHSPTQGDGSDGGNGCKEKGERCDGPRKEFNFWTDQEVWLLLDAYEDKWNQLDRGNVKSKHWEEVATRLAAQGNGLWTAKTPTQCKNKIEDMKKKYRAEKAMKNGTYSKWVFYQRMEGLLRSGFKGVGMENGEHAQQVLDLDSYGNCAHLENIQYRHCLATRLVDKDMNEAGCNDDEDTCFSTPHHIRKEGGVNNGYMESSARARDDVHSLKRRKHLGAGSSSMSEVISAIKQFGESLIKIEEAQIELQREVVRLNAEAEVRRVEMEMKRTEMMLKTQLEIAKLLSVQNRRKKVVKKAQAQENVVQQTSEAHNI